MLLIACRKDRRVLTMEAEEWESAVDEIQLSDYEDGTRGIMIAENTGRIDQEIMVSDEHQLQPGAYKVTVNYTSIWNPESPSKNIQDTAGKLVLFSYKNNTAISTSTIKLDDGAHSRTSRLWVRFGKELDDFRGKILYNGQGQMSVHSVVLEEYMGWRIVRILGFLFLFALIDGIYLLFAKHTFFELSTEKKYQICGLGGIILFTSMLYFTDALYYGHDLTFHLERIHAMAEAFTEGQFPHRIQSNMLNGYGYVNPLFYGELFLSLPAALYCLFVPLQTCYKVYAITLNVVTCLISWHCFKKMSKDWKIGLFITFLYTASAYRMVDIFVRADVGEYTAMTFLPLVVYGFWKVYTKADDEKITMKDYLPIVLGLTGIMESHILTCYMLAVFIPLFVLILWKKTFQAERFLALVKSVGLLVLLNVWFVYPLVESLGMNIKITQAGTSGKIEQYGVTLSQILGIFHTATGDSIWDGTKGEMPLTTGIGVSIAIVLFLYVCVKQKEWLLEQNRDYTNAKVGFGLSVIALYFASAYCPWDSLAGLHPKINHILGTIQFSWRYLEIATIMLSVVMLFLMRIFLEKYGRQVTNWVMVAIAVLALISEGLFMMQYPNEITYKKYYAESELTGFDVGSGMEYILHDTDIDGLLTNDILTTEGVSAGEMTNDKGNRLVAVDNETQQEGYVDIPVLFYDNYRAYDQATGTELPLQTGVNNRICIVIPAGYQGTICVCYREPGKWRLAEGISVVTLLGIIGYMGMMGIKTRNDRKEE